MEEWFRYTSEALAMEETCRTLEQLTTAATEEWAFSGIPPTAPAAGYSDAIVGQMYYNSTSGQFKAIKSGGAPIGTWASGGSLNTS